MKAVRFCKHCGYELEKENPVCPNCGEEIIRNEETNIGVKIKPILAGVVEKVKEKAKNINFSSDSIYILDLFKRLLSFKNIPIVIYMILNLGIICFFFMLPALETPELETQCLVTGIVIYFISLIVALSPVGEFILRLQNGCKKIKDPEQLKRIEPLFQEVYDKARLEHPGISDKIKLYIKHEKSVNAFATGRRTICVMEGLLDCDDEIIKATLAHEFGHLAHKDTDLILLVAVGNMIVTVLLVAFRVFIKLVHFMISLGSLFVGKEGFFTAFASMISSVLTTVLITAFQWAWTKIGILLVMKSSRAGEYAADEFAMKLGYGNALCGLLDSIPSVPEKGLFANLMSSHPGSKKRIENLCTKGCTYRKVSAENF